MLSPRYLDGLADEIADIYAQLEADILQDMARRIARLGKITEATQWQAALLAETGALKKNIRRILKKYDPAIVKETEAVYNDALIKNARADNMIFKEALGHGVSDINAQIMLASIQKTHSDLSRLTITTAYTSETMFVQQANNAYMQVTTGAFDYDRAMENACDNLAAEGITSVQYRNGRPVRLQIEPAVRMNILTGVNQTASAMTMNNCEELGVDLVETTAHIGARPEHEEWQGQVFSLSGTHPKYRPFSVCGLGTITGICGINCRHSYYPYFEGFEKHYTQDDLDEMAKQEVTYNGQKMTRYEGEEKLRYIERNIRGYKRRALVQEAGGVDSTRARRKLGEWQQKARDFTEQTGIERDRAREFIGTADGKQPKGIFTNAKEIKGKETTLNAPSNTKDLARPAIKAAPLKTKAETDAIINSLEDSPETYIHKLLELKKVEKVPFLAYAKQPTEAEIIERIAGGDREGNCASLAHAYIANKAGFNVQDFRGGTSREIFRDRDNMVTLAAIKGIKARQYKTNNPLEAFRELIKFVQPGKEYELAVGGHTAIVRQGKNGLEYLELQNYEHRGWKQLTEKIAKRRFDLDLVDSIENNIIMEIDGLIKSREFIKLIYYINTVRG